MLTLFMLLGCAVPTSEQRGTSAQLEGRENASIDLELKRHGLSRDLDLDPRVVTAWNETAHDIAFAEDQFLTFKGQRALAMMHLAMHDALNSIVPAYERYAYHGGRHFAHPVVAAAQAAYEVLVSQYPDQRPRLESELARWHELARHDAWRERGITLGRSAAAAILKVRAHDGWDVQGDYTFRSGPGEYQTTPPWDGFVAQPGFRFAQPFALGHAAQFRPPSPPPLTSRAYARAYREVKEFGAADSALRSPDQTGYAVWWMEFAEGSVNRLARQLVVEHGIDLWPTARMFAQLGTALFDGYVAVWDSKYEYNHWRPYTAIRQAETDGNPRTTAESAWEPLRRTPPFPEYVSAHATGCAAAFGILERTLGNDVSFTMDTRTAPAEMPTRTFTSFRTAAAECADSRVRLGWHFRYATDTGFELGRRISRYVATRLLRPERGPIRKP